VQHRVRITKPFGIGVTEVTQSEYEQVMGRNPSKFPGEPTRPVEYVSWEEAVEFCLKLSELPAEKYAKREYHLPTEAQWEYACRAGSLGRRYVAEQSTSPPAAAETVLSQHGWFGRNSGNQTHPVAQLRTNAWGLHDMYGNVWEWCKDWYEPGYYGNSPKDDPLGASKGSDRVYRGGCYIDPSWYCRSAFRRHLAPRARFSSLGFRVSVTLPESLLNKGNAAQPPLMLTDDPAERPARESANKLAPPTPEEQKALTATLDDTYRIAEAKDPDSKAVLAERLLQDGRNNVAHRAEQFVMLRRASELARDAANVDLMLEAVDVMADAGFEIQPWKVKSRLLKMMESQSDRSDVLVLSEIAAAYVTSSKQAAADGAFEESAEMLDAAQATLGDAKKHTQVAYRAARLAANRGRNSADKAAREEQMEEMEREVASFDAALSAVVECAKRFQQERRVREAIHAAQERLSANPDDAEACLTVGRWLCFDQGEWDRGLALLAKGSDDVLKSLAAGDLSADPTRAESRVARGDAWWDAAEKATAQVRTTWRQRAGQWYQDALAELTGSKKAMLERRLAQAVDEPSPEGRPSRLRPTVAIAPFDEKTAQVHQVRWAKHLHVPVVEINSMGMRLVLIPPGEFDMGSPKELIEELSRLHAADAMILRGLPGEMPKHRVAITKPFRLGVTEVTQAEYLSVMGTNPSLAQGDARRPVEQLSWDEAVEFCRRLSELPKERSAKRQYRLPTEAQWEYACRAGNSGSWCYSAQPAPLPWLVEKKLLAQFAWFDENADGKTHPIAQKRTNAWGLHDMYGNVWDWCQDWYDPEYYAMSPKEDPTGPEGGVYRVIRGGSWHSAGVCRSAFRGHWSPSGDYHIGLRVALPVEEPTAEVVNTRERGALDAPYWDAAEKATGEAKAAVRNRVDHERREDSTRAKGGRTAQALPGKDTSRRPPPMAVAPFDEKMARQYQTRWAEYLDVPLVITNSIGMKFVLIPPGDFEMGSALAEISQALAEAKRTNDRWAVDRVMSEGPRHRVRITKALYLALNEVTQSEYQQVMGVNPSSFSAQGEDAAKVAGLDTSRHPVEMVSWEDATMFCRKLTAMPEEQAAARVYQLPTDAQWEFACRAGTGTIWFFGEDARTIKEYAWCKETSEGRTHAVGELKPNGFGLFDMHGNVWEWCLDWWAQGWYANSSSTDPTGPASGSERVDRGGQWNGTAANCRSSVRNHNAPDHRYNGRGFRVAFVPAQ